MIFHMAVPDTYAQSAMLNHDEQHHPADALLESIERIGSPVCVGIDPVLERLPATLNAEGNKPGGGVLAIRAFVLELLDVLQHTVPCVKFQSACFERYGSAGMGVLEEMIGRAREHKLCVILDAKRGDIGHSADHYAAAAFENDHPADWITINSFLGADGIRPFLEAGRGGFALVRTSNPSGDAIQSLQLRDGRSVAEAVAEMIARCGETYPGTSGYSALGAVVGATKSDEAAKLRAIMPRQIFLVPGYGAQGGSAEDVLPCFNSDRTGAIITASRSVIYAFEPADREWKQSIATAAKSFAREIATAIKRGNHRGNMETAEKKM